MGNKNQKEQSIIIKKIERGDITAAIALHEGTIPSAGARMGEPYLRKLYTTLIEHPDTHFVFGAFENTQLIGVISATNDFSKTSRLLNKQIFSLIPTVLFGLIKNHYSFTELVSHAMVKSQIKKLLDSKTVYIVNLAVDSQIQRQGVATKLIEKLLSQSKTKSMLVDTQKSNTTAQKFYKKIGFVPVMEVADSVIFKFKITDIPSASQ